jgi:hypothetical protein
VLIEPYTERSPVCQIYFLQHVGHVRIVYKNFTWTHGTCKRFWDPSNVSGIFGTFILNYGLMMTL